MSLSVGHLCGVSDRSFSIFLVGFQETTWITRVRPSVLRKVLLGMSMVLDVFIKKRSTIESWLSWLLADLAYCFWLRLDYES
jgi:hypothetical protein